MQGWVIAVTTEQRLEYMKFLAIYGKKRIFLTDQHKQLISAFEV